MKCSCGTPTRPFMGRLRCPRILGGCGRSWSEDELAGVQPSAPLGALRSFARWVRRLVGESRPCRAFVAWRERRALNRDLSAFAYHDARRREGRILDALADQEGAIEQLIYEVKVLRERTEEER